MRWVWNHPEIITVLSGMNTEAQIAENIRIASDAEAGSLTDEELRIITEAGKTFRNVMKVLCTGCQYCMPCPKNINIPLVLGFEYPQHFSKLFKKKTGDVSGCV